MQQIIYPPGLIARGRRQLAHGASFYRMKLPFRGGDLVSILGILITAILGMFMLAKGLETQKKWLLVLSVPLILIALSQIAILFLMALFH